MPVCWYVNHDEKKNGRTDIFLPSNEQEDLKKSIQIMPELYENRMLQIIWNKIFRLDVIKQNHIRFKEEMFIGEDFRFLLEYMKAAKISGFFFVNKALCHYMRDNENSLMSRLLETKIQDSLDNFEIMYELMGKSSVEIEKLIAEEKQTILITNAAKIAATFHPYWSCFSVIAPTTYPMIPTIINVNGAHAVHPDNRSNNPIPTPPAIAPVFLPNKIAIINRGTFPK